MNNDMEHADVLVNTTGIRE